MCFVQVINQVCGRPIKLHLQICLFYPLQCDIIILAGIKITQAIHLLLDICKNGKLFFNPGISIFRISIYLQTNLESNLNSNIQYIRFSSSIFSTNFFWSHTVNLSHKKTVIISLLKTS